MPVEKIASYELERLEILGEDGSVDEGLEPDLAEEDLLALYSHMVLAREDDQRMLKMQRQGRVGTFGPCTGHEASVVGPAYALTGRDWFVGAFRELGARLVRGEPLTHGYLFHNGYEEGNVFEGMERTLPISIIVGSQSLHAAGIGYALKLRGEKDAAVLTYIGDGGSSQGDFHEALNFASTWQAPVVFVIQNNQWAISVPRSKQANARTLAQRAIAYDIPGIQVDGNDVLATYVAARDALERARSGGGPSLIETTTYRLLMHTTADDPTKYRSEEEVERWWKRDPIPRFRGYLEKKGIWDGQREAALLAKVRAEVDAAVKEFEARKDFKPDAPFDHVFGTRHDVIEEQRRDFLAGLGEEG
jgi:pyruvate dehydrogenase E1 component alpha subunit